MRTVFGGLALVLALAAVPQLALATSPPPPVQAAPAARSAAVANAPAVPLATVVGKLQARYDRTKTFRAAFTQVYKSAAFGRARTSSGKVVFKKPGKMRWDYDKPEPTLFVSDGKTLWMAQLQDKQAFRQSLGDSQLPAALVFLLGKGRLAKEFVIAFATDAAYGRPGDLRLSLTPKQPQATYKAITFVVDPKDYFVRETVLVDTQGNVNHLTFSAIEENPKLADALFAWSPGKDMRVIEGQGP